MHRHVQDHFQVKKTLRIPVSGAAPPPVVTEAQSRSAKARRFASKNGVSVQEATYYLAGNDYDELAAQAEFDEDAHAHGAGGGAGAGAADTGTNDPPAPSAPAATRGGGVEDPGDGVSVAVVTGSLPPSSAMML